MRKPLSSNVNRSTLRQTTLSVRELSTKIIVKVVSPAGFEPITAGFIDDVVVAFESRVGEFILAEIFPDVLGAAELWRIAREADEGDGGKHA